jgi:hypothetical protein
MLCTWISDFRGLTCANSTEFVEVGELVNNPCVLSLEKTIDTRSDIGITLRGRPSQLLPLEPQTEQTLFYPLNGFISFYLCIYKKTPYICLSLCLYVGVRTWVVIMLVEINYPAKHTYIFCLLIPEILWWNFIRDSFVANVLFILEAARK